MDYLRGFGLISVPFGAFWCLARAIWSNFQPIAHGLVCWSFCHFVILPFCLSVFLSVCLVVWLSVGAVCLAELPFSHAALHWEIGNSAKRKGGKLKGGCHLALVNHASLGSYGTFEFCHSIFLPPFCLLVKTFEPSCMCFSPFTVLGLAPR